MATLLLVGCGPVTFEGATPAERGGQIYRMYCVSCHQEDGSGRDGALAGSFVGPESRLSKPDDELLRSIANGVRGSVGVMPGWDPTLTPDQRRDVLAYLRQQFRPAVTKE